MANGGEAMSQREKLLLEASRDGDTVAFAALLRESAPALERLALRLVGDRHDAEDIAQDTVLKAWRKLPGFKGESRFRTWVCRILVHRALDFLRRRRPTEEVREHLPAVVRDPHAEAAAQELDHAIRRAIEELPPVQRATLLLRADQGLSYEEIAYVLGSTRNAVRMNLVAARKRLAERLQGHVDLGGDA
ncbi:MAG TPA: sigma-70 family RNA polymerase sigma factor [Planctomycetota bacterium]|nr:sigma-70 family RNA polymerase sigma factor [Planctomycetota bacterium]